MAIGIVDLPANTWVKIVDGTGLDAVTWQAKTDNINIGATSADAAPSGDYDAWPEYEFGQGEAAINAATFFAGVSGVTYLWAYSAGKDGKIWRSHA